MEEINLIKKRYLFLIIIFCIFTVSAASAEEIVNDGLSNDTVGLSDIKTDFEVLNIEPEELSSDMTYQQYDSSVKINNISGLTYGDALTVNFDIDNRSDVEVVISDSNNKKVLYETAYLNEIYAYDLDAGTYTVTVNNLGNEMFKPSHDSKNFTIHKAGSLVTIEDIDNVNYGSDSIISLNVVNETTINYILKKGDEKIQEGSYYSQYMYFGILDAGFYNFTVSNAETNNYKSSSDTKTFNVYKSNSVMDIDIGDFDVDLSYIAIIRLNDDATGNVTIYIDGKEVETESINSGNAAHMLQGLKAGKHNIKAVYSGDNNYLSNSTSADFNVNPLNSDIEIDSTYLVRGDDLIIRVPYGATGMITLSINGKNYDLPVNNYYAAFNTKVLSKGIYPINIHYSGDDMYSDCELTSNIEIVTDCIIDAPSFTKYYSGSERFVVTLSDGAGNPLSDQNIYITINGATYTRTTDSEGKSSIAVNLPPGEYDIIVKYKDSNVTSKVTVLTTVLGNDIVKIYGNATQYYATFLDTEGNYLSQGIRVIFNLNNIFYSQEIMDNKGSAKLDIDEKQGAYIVTTTNPVTGEMHSNTITVISNIVENYDLTKYYNESSKFSVKILSSNGKLASGAKVKFSIGNNMYESTTNSNGYAFLNTVLQPGEYIVKTAYGENEASNAIKILATLNEGDMKVSSSDISMGDDEVIKVTLPDDATGKVSTAVNGKEYSANVNKGVANINIPDLRHGTYNVDVNYSGDLKYNSLKGKTSFTVDSNIDMSVSDVIKYYGGSERLYLTLKNKNGQPIADAKVKININNVDYDRTTGADGKTSIALSIPAGNYTATVEYDGIKTTSNVVIKSTVSGNDITKIYKNATQYYAKFVDAKGNILKNTPVDFNINGVFYTRTTNEKGIAKMNINLNPKEYIITATNPNSGEMYSNVVKVLSNIAENHDLTKYYKNASQYVIRLLDGSGKPVGAGKSVQFNINGVFYTRTSNATGHVKMNINLNPDTYIITANYNGLMTSNTIKVLSVLEAKDLAMKYKDGSKFEVKLLDGKGNPSAGKKITFNINGVFYDRTTNASGIARLNINLQSGNYVITSSYNGLNIANNIRIALDPMYYTIGNNPLDYNYYMNEYNKFSLDWYYVDQYESNVKTIYDIYGNMGMELQNVRYGVKYICWEQSTGYSYSLNKDGELISVTNMMDYYVEYKTYDYNNNEIIYRNIYLPNYDTELTTEIDGYDVNVHQWRTPSYSEVDIIVTDKNGNMLNLYDYDTKILNNGKWYGPYDQAANYDVSTYHKWHMPPNSRTTEVAVKIKALMH